MGKTIKQTRVLLSQKINVDLSSDSHKGYEDDKVGEENRDVKVGIALCVLWHGQTSMKTEPQGCGCVKKSIFVKMFQGFFHLKGSA